MPAKKIAIAVPSTDLCHTDFAFSLASMFAYVARERRDVMLLGLNIKGSLVQVNRHNLVKEAKKYGCEYIMFIDTDMQFQHDLVTRLLDCDKDIVGLMALLRQIEACSNTYGFNDEQIHYDKTGLIEVKYMGTAAVLIKLSVFDKIGLPYFKVDFKEDRYPQWVGEDNDFCNRARAAGYKIWCHMDLSRKLKHIGSKHYGFTEEKLNAK